MTGAATDLARVLAGGAFAGTFVRGRQRDAQQDASALPRRLPEEAWLHARFGLEANESLEAWSADFFGVATPCWHATPVNIQVGHYQLLLDDPGDLGLTQAEADALGASVAELFAEAGLELVTAAPLHWFLRGRADWNLDARSWTMAVGRSIDGYLPSGPDARAWRRLFNDAQITWHDHPVNRDRESRGLRPVNALWLDGCARKVPTAPGTAVATRDPALSGLARSAGCRLIPSGPDSLDRTALAAAACGEDLLIDLDFWQRARRHSDPAAWHDAWLRFDRWIADAGLASGAPAGFARLRAVFSGERRWVELETARAQRWQFWRTFDPLATVFAR